MKSVTRDKENNDQMKTQKTLLKKKDCTGRKLSKGDIVRVVGLPNLSTMPATTRRESEPVFRYLKKKYKRIFAFSKDGLAEIEFRIREGNLPGLHTVSIEPRLLRQKQ